MHKSVISDYHQAVFLLDGDCYNQTLNIIEYQTCICWDYVDQQWCSTQQKKPSLKVNPPIVAISSDAQFPLSANHPPLLMPHREHTPPHCRLTVQPGSWRQHPSKHTPCPDGEVLPCKEPTHEWKINNHGYFILNMEPPDASRYSSGAAGQAQGATLYWHPKQQSTLRTASTFRTILKFVSCLLFLSVAHVHTRLSISQFTFNLVD